MYRLIIATIATILLYPSVAFAADGTTPPADLVQLIFASWGQWSVVGGLAMLLAIQVWRHYKPEVWDKLHPAVRRLLPPAVSALTTAAVGLTVGGTWEEFALVFCGQLFALYIGVEGIGGGGSIVDSLLDKRQKAIAKRVIARAADAVSAANAKRSGKPPIIEDDLPPAA